MPSNVPPLPPLAPVDDDTVRTHDSARPPRTVDQPRAHLRVFRGLSSLVYSVAARGTTIGRAGDGARAEILVDDPRTSRTHARLTFGGQGWTLTDTSRNGTFVDGAVVSSGASAGLAHGSVIRVGDTIAVFATELLDEPDVADPSFFPGVSAAALRVRRRVDVLARGSGHVLVLGETGTGKERVARRIGGGGPFVAVNCGELSRELARSELFGHVKGAFSGAPGREGLVAAGGDGVLFLDELGELPLDVQPELLRFLEDGGYRLVGAAELRTSRARVVAATNVDLDLAVRRGTFRRDLLARLRASNPPLSLPPLRERREDVPGWVEHFMRELVSELPAVPCDAGALECLLLFPWAENLRELRGAIRGALEEPRAWPVTAARLPARVHDHRVALRSSLAGAPGAAGTAPATAPVARPVDADAGADDDEPAEPPTREQIIAALTTTRGNMLAAARTLHIGRRTLYRLCDQHELAPNTFRPGD